MTHGELNRVEQFASGIRVALFPTVKFSMFWELSIGTREQECYAFSKTLAKIKTNYDSKHLTVEIEGDGSPAMYAHHVFLRQGKQFLHCTEYIVKKIGNKSVTTTRLKVSPEPKSICIAIIPLWGCEFHLVGDSLRGNSEGRTFLLKKQFNASVIRRAENAVQLCLNNFDYSMPMTRNIAITRFYKRVTKREEGLCYEERHFVFYAHHVQFSEGGDSLPKVLDEQGNLTCTVRLERLTDYDSVLVQVAELVLPAQKKESEFSWFSTKVQKFTCGEWNIGHTFDRNTGCAVFEISNETGDTASEKEPRRPVEATLSLVASSGKMVTKTGFGFVGNGTTMTMRFHASELLEFYAEPGNLSGGPIRLWVSERYKCDAIPFSMVYGDNRIVFEVLRYVCDLYQRCMNKNVKSVPFRTKGAGQWLSVLFDEPESISILDLYAVAQNPLFAGRIGVTDIRDYVRNVLDAFIDLGKAHGTFRIAGRKTDDEPQFSIPGTEVAIYEDDTVPKSYEPASTEREGQPAGAYFAPVTDKLPLFSVAIPDWSRGCTYLETPTKKFLWAGGHDDQFQLSATDEAATIGDLRIETETGDKPEHLQWKYDLIDGNIIPTPRDGYEIFDGGSPLTGTTPNPLIWDVEGQPRFVCFVPPGPTHAAKPPAQGTKPSGKAPSRGKPRPGPAKRGSK